MLLAAEQTDDLFSLPKEINPAMSYVIESSQASLLLTRTIPSVLSFLDQK